MVMALNTSPVSTVTAGYIRLQQVLGYIRHGIKSYKKDAFLYYHRLITRIYGMSSRSALYKSLVYGSLNLKQPILQPKIVRVR